MIQTKMPIQNNGNPTDEEMEIRRAIHVLQDVCDDGLVLMQDSRFEVYLLPAILGEDAGEDEQEVDGEIVTVPRLPGTIQYQVSDGLPGNRSTSFDFDNLKDAIQYYKGIVEQGGWGTYFHKNKNKE